MHLPRIPLCTIQNRNAHISVLNGALWDMQQVLWDYVRLAFSFKHRIISKLELLLTIVNR